ncbi:phospholipase D family protein [Acidovorax sp. LjRoot129]|uniref:phospholipase D family nuclease n=1 Tax=unclassified Acidovorax TaxID=2684926 RepID=UPI003ECF9A09
MALLLCLGLSAGNAAEGWGGKAQRMASDAGEQLRKVRELTSPGGTVVNSRGSIEVAFSPNQGAEELVLRVIDSAQGDLRVMAYSFTSAKVTAALVRAVKRGVHVYVLADKKQNLGEGNTSKSRSALATLQLAGAQVRVVGAYPIFHDKVILTPRTVQTGSFNYSQAAATRNSENVIVHWDNPELVAVYAGHFASNWKLSEPFEPGY